MKNTLIAGANVSLSSTDVVLKFSYRVEQGELDISAYLLAENTGKVRGDTDMLFFGQRYAENGAIVLDIGENCSILRINTINIDPEIKKIAICATIDGAANLSALENLSFTLKSSDEEIANAQEKKKSRLEAALILAEIYRHQGAWKCRWVMQGFKGGLQSLAEYFGVDIADNETENVIKDERWENERQENQTSEIRLTNILLSRENTYYRVENRHLSGLIKINLNWETDPKTKQGFLHNILGSNVIDLDLGAMVRLKDGSTHVVQALGSHFGSRYQPPFLELQGDDRTGENEGNEWLFLNSEHWQQIDLVVIFCFVYRGKEWAKASISLQIPNHGKIEIPLGEYDQNLGLCGVVELRNQSDDIGVQRIMKYFFDHRKLDQYYGFGIEWQNKSK